MKKSILLFVILIAGICSQTQAQKQGQELIDSLQAELKNYNVSKIELRRPMYDNGDTLKVNILYELGWELMGAGDNAKARQYADDAMAVSEKIDFKKGTAKAYDLIGIIYQAQGNYTDALKNHFAALKIDEKIGDKKNIAGSYTNIGLIYFDQGNYTDALKNHFDALKIEEEIGAKIDIGNSYMNIGLVYEQQGDYPDALKNFFASLKIFEEIGSKRGIAGSYNNIGNVYGLQGNYPDALNNQLAALKMEKETGDKNGMAATTLILEKYIPGSKNIQKQKNTQMMD